MRHRATEDAENSGFVCREVSTDKTKPPLKRNKLILGEAQSGGISVLDFLVQAFSFAGISRQMKISSLCSQCLCGDT